MAGIPHTHTIVCDYRGFGISTLDNLPHIPTESGIITDAISIVSYVLHDLKHPSSRTVILGQSLGTAVSTAAALYFTDPNSDLLPKDIVKPSPAIKEAQSFAGIVLAAPFTTVPELLKTYRIKGIIPVFSPLQNYPKIENYLRSKIIDLWPTLPRLQALLSAARDTSTPIHISILHARNDQEINFRISEAVYAPLESMMLVEEGASSTEERRSIHGGERVKRGAFAYRRVENAKGERSIELEIVRYGGHSEGVGWAQVGLAVRRAFKTKVYRPGLDVE